MSDKICCVFGHKEADPEREEELEGVLKSYIEKGVSEFVFCEVNKFSLQCLRVIKRLKDRYKIFSSFALTEEMEIDKKVLKNFDFDLFFLDERSRYRVQSKQQLVEKSDFILIQWFDTLHDKDDILLFANELNKPVLKF